MLPRARNVGADEGPSQQGVHEGLQATGPLPLSASGDPPVGIYLC